jgi:ectoine hydroxylase-related dioxygenase (phytanoyl-CoA dioxygenase family)
MLDLPPHFPAEHDALRRRHDGAGDLHGAASLRDPGLLQGCAQLVRSRGFAVVRDLLSRAEVTDVAAEIERDIAAWPADAAPHTGGPPPYVDFDPAVTAGLVVPRTRELSVRRLFRLTHHNSHFRRLVLEDDRMQAPARALLGDDLVVMQSMALLKPPGTSEKRFHQDQGVFRLADDQLGASCVMGWWIAIDRVEHGVNGAMVFQPYSQKAGIVHHELPVPASPTAHIHYSVAQCPAPEETVFVDMEPGDALLFDVACVHGSGPNRSDAPRRALQMQYAPASARPTRCPQGQEGLAVTGTVGEVFDGEEEAGAEGESALPTTAWFDCDASIQCTEPQYWSYRKPEARL